MSSPPSKLNDTFAIDLPPASQLDSSVLEALPPELIDKILRSYCAKEDQDNKTRGSAVAGSVPGVQKCPFRPGGRLAEDGGVGRRGRGRGRGRGRRRGRGTGSPIKSPSKRGNKVTVTESPKKQTRLFELLPESSSEAKEFQKQGNGRRSESLNPQLISSNHEPIEPLITTSCEVTAPDPQDILLAEFRAFLKEWVRESPGGPLESDLEKMTAYFVELCGSDSASVFVVLCGFRRLALNTGDVDWWTAFNILLGSVQECISSEHKAVFPIDPL